MSDPKFCHFIDVTVMILSLRTNRATAVQHVRCIMYIVCVQVVVSVEAEDFLRRMCFLPVLFCNFFYFILFQKMFSEQQIRLDSGSKAENSHVRLIKGKSAFWYELAWCTNKVTFFFFFLKRTPNIIIKYLTF